MKQFIKELRRREVFRTSGLYVGICWILIEVGSVILPVFGVPDWVFRGAIVAAVVGFPFMLVLAWFFDVNEEGISLQGDTTESSATQLGARKSDFAIIGVLVVALLVSLSLNVRKQSPTVEALALEPTPVLLANIDNTTGDPVFDRVLEQALITGLEVAPHVVVFAADGETDIEGQSRSAGVRATINASRRVVPRESLKLRLSGAIEQSGNGYLISVEGVDANTGQAVFTLTEKAGSREMVLSAAGKLSEQVRKELGEEGAGDEEGQFAQAFVAASLEAANAFALARQNELANNLQEAARHYEQASTADPDLGRAFSGLALVELASGRVEEAAEHRARAGALMNTMTEREWLQFLGRYEALAALDGDAVMSVYSELVDKYPADTGARERYAIAAFEQTDFSTSIEQTRAILALFPADLFHRTRLAYYEMYAGNWDTAADEAQQVISAEPEYGSAYLPIAMAALARGDGNASRDAYQQMAETGATEGDASLALLGLVDIDLVYGDFSAAQARSRAGIEVDIEREDNAMAALKYIALAQAYAGQANLPEATTAVERALSLTSSDASSVSAAMIYLQAGDLDSVRAIANGLAERHHAHSLAFGKMLNGLILEREGAATEAILTMRDAIDTADLWLIRYETSKAYLRAGNFVQALGELTTLQQRAGEATSVFLDDMPTYRYKTELAYWIGRAKEGLGMQAAARESYQQYLALRQSGGALAEDASARADRLE